LVLTISITCRRLRGTDFHKTKYFLWATIPEKPHSPCGQVEPMVI